MSVFYGKSAMLDMMGDELLLIRSPDINRRLVMTNGI